MKLQREGEGKRREKGRGYDVSLVAVSVTVSNHSYRGHKHVGKDLHRPTTEHITLQGQ